MDFNEPQNYINRELSWLDFNMRVLSEARDKSNPLMERVKFLAITGSNLDEFYMVRVASLKNAVGSDKRDASGMTPREQLTAISEKAHDMVEQQYNVLNRSLVPAMRDNGIVILSHERLSEKQKKFTYKYFSDELYPILTPMAVDSSRPFPLIQNKKLNIGALIKKPGGDEAFATVQVPTVVPRLIALPSSNGAREFILIEEIIRMYLGILFSGFDVICAYPYRVMRDADIPLDEDEDGDLLQEIKKTLKKRERSHVIRLEVEEGVSKTLLSVLKKSLEISKEDIYRINGPLDLTIFNSLYSQGGLEHLKYQPKSPQTQARLVDKDIFEEIKNGDILMHHPYDSFETVVNFIKKASQDPSVLAIKQTLYRVSGNSPIIRALSEAAENGKQVTVLVELKARFDEGNNIIWATKLEKAGCHVIYGLLGLKTHSKITVIVRSEDDGIRRYVHLGTGNYNDITAKFYTDMGILTCNEAIGADASAFFNMISGYSEPPQWNHLVLAPHHLRKKTVDMIEREIRHAEAGKKAHIIAKVNSMLDPEITALLYKASCAGVKIDLIVRGICSLRAGVPGLSENISVRSIIGRYLEHTRIYYFYNNGMENTFLASADWMPRNLDRRVEIMFPVLDSGLKERVKHVLDVQLSDIMRSHIQKDGIYEKQDKRGKRKIDCQIVFQEEAEAAAVPPAEETMNERRFIPMEKPHE